MEKVLGLDLGTNSIGWAIVARDEQAQTLLNKGVSIFQEGVMRTKSGEQPMVQDRTNARALRRHYFRRRLRKIELLEVLIRHGLCPALTEEELHTWKQKKIYPLNEEFILWQRTDEQMQKNPYHDRFIAITEELNLATEHGRYTLGRALYHLSQRRGFLSNRKDTAKDSEDGKVKEDIKSLSKEMKLAGCRYLGEYFYHIYGKEHIRRHYTARVEHYQAEFEAICTRQHLSEELRKELHRAIFYQRPLKSQKGLVGKCTFEKKKARCPISHPRFEEFRMLQFVNNILIRTPQDEDYRRLSQEEFLAIESLFFRKPHFQFEEIAKKIAGRNKFACKDNRAEVPYHFNYSATTTVSGCPVTAQLRAIFGEDYEAGMASVYLKGAGKTSEQILGDIWHALFSFDDDSRLTAWAKTNLQLSDEDAEAFAKINMPQDYASLSLNAINKILPVLRRGYTYDKAVFMANIDKVLPEEILCDKERTEQIKRDILIELDNNIHAGQSTREAVIINYLENMVGIDKEHMKHLYHPSMIEHYPATHPDENGLMQLGSPRISAIRNPMAMRALFRMRALINCLLREGQIDPKTKINIEFARGLNDANMRKAIENDNRRREAKHAEYTAEIHKLLGADYPVTETDLLKYQLWEEQKHICPYTGKTIAVRDFIGQDVSFDIEHTVPRSMDGDNSQMNKTLCENHFNRDIKKGQLPTMLGNYAEVVSRIESFGWQENADKLEKQISKQRILSKTATTKSDKDKAIQRRHELEFELRYWRGKLERFTILDVPEGFSNRQGVDIGIIGRYARLYLKTVFEKIYTVKGATTAEFRKMWGLQDKNTKKVRDTHIHHCIDAITIACIGAKEYTEWAHYASAEEYYRRGQGARPVFPKPWATFTEDVRSIGNELLIAHHTADNMGKQSRRKIKINGRVQYAQGDTARGVLHQQTFYGAIQREDGLKYVIRKPLDALTKKDIPNIVDEAVREKIRAEVEQYGEPILKDTEHTIWMNEEKRIPIRKVRLFATSITQPIHLKKQRDLSTKGYKQDYHVANDSNYCMGIYVGADSKGKIKRGFKLVNNLEAAHYFNERRKGNMFADLLPMSDEHEYPLRYILRAGTMVLFYEQSPEELYDASKEELAKRLYKITGLTTKVTTYGWITLLHHQCAQQSGKLKEETGSWKIADPTKLKMGLYHTQFTALVEGYDFELTVTGEIKFKH